MIYDQTDGLKFLKETEENLVSCVGLYIQVTKSFVVLEQLGGLGATVEPRYNAHRYNTRLGITQFILGPQNFHFARLL